MVRLVVKNAGQPDFPLELSDSGTVGDLKDELQRSYPSHPTPAQQKLIFAGRLLNDGSQIISHLITASKDIRRSAPAAQQHAPQQLPPYAQPHPRFVPGNGVAPPAAFVRPQFVPAAAPPQVAPAAAPRPPAGPGILGRQNWALLVKLVVIIYILSQGGDSLRLSILSFGAFLVYLYQMGLFPRLNRRAAAAAPVAQQAPPAAVPERAPAAEAEGDAPAPREADEPAAAPAAAAATTGSEAQARQPAQGGLWREMENLFLPFVYSLIPTWQPAAMAQPVPLPVGQPPQVHHNHPHHD
ncbi:ubiquitin family protein [Acanthamoeba castellanii str. Neff]|uniref:Ubiquitin family protein n=1 Tax=Acanthamoeba castellanii (strain ATCC 30010 / Neff) TaxID=1257118 RepID=L8HII2_ACACF|nr:ubiquitin family protein [Acanthamoeba castellanii str. Neff]ELR24191.1 ubiquitin family protein [Acanthamoeba castellanii str. Neff]